MIYRYSYFSLSDRFTKTMTHFSKIISLESLFLCLLIVGISQNVEAENHSNGTPVALNGVTQYDFKTDRLDVPLKVYVLKPSGYDPTLTYPVLYSFDADLSLGFMSIMSDKVARLSMRANRRPPIVVTIGYDNVQMALKRRIFDLTPHADTYNLPMRPNGQPWPKMGGGDNFLDILIEEIKPFVEKRYKIDTTAETLFGHSLGGLLTLHAIFTKTEHFDRFAASSPSLWFNPQATMHKLIAFHKDTTKTGTTQKIPLRLTIGGNEETLTDWTLQYSKNPDLRKKWLQKNKMVQNARALYQALSEQDGKIQIEFETYGGLEHILADAPAFFRALQFATTDGSP